jgi:uncharacterized membrane protein YgcG
LPANGPNQSESIAAALTDISERLTRLVHDEIELAKAEMADKTASLARGAAAIAAGAVFGIFAVIFLLMTLAWGIDAILVSGAGSIWLGFLIVAGVLLVLTFASGLFAWRKVRVGVPAPTMAIDEAKRIRDTVTSPGQTLTGSGPALTGSGQTLAGSGQALSTRTGGQL